MKLRIETNRLVLTVSTDEQAALRRLHDENPDRFDTDESMYELLEPLVTHNQFNWIDPSVTGDLTSAPMLAVLGDEEPGPDDDVPGSGLVPIGRWKHEGRLRSFYEPVLYRWAFMSYQVTTPQRQLMESGQAVFEGGVALERAGQMELGAGEIDSAGEKRA